MAKTLLRRDFKTDTWANVKAYVDERIAAMHVDLESFNLDAEKTAAVRGRISELKKLLALEGAPADVARPGDIVRFAGSQEPPPSSDDGM